MSSTPSEKPSPKPGTAPQAKPTAGPNVDRVMQSLTSSGAIQSKEH